ncbi:AraC family transcriptional regulator [Chitinophaga filiformis]|uniref:AraC family transcriptional regulator n=1 Tax=Chitinophaga filiformis TaxID=104663 RepID=UPI001F4363B6|nr:helix-turn-helix domain-containing protein [Chitinophaga filiformis]MCF6403747.1 AraC family transcriptional regulator [Chitinophaga filiformis]
MHTAHILNIDINPALKDSFSVEDVNGQLSEDNTQRRISFNELILVKDGYGTILIDGGTYNITPHSLFVISKGQIYAVNDKHHLEGYVLQFGDCFWEKAPASASNCKAVLFNDPSGHQQMQLNEQDEAMLLNLMTTILDEFREPDYVNKADALAAYLKILMIKVANINSLLHTGHSTNDNKLYRQYVELVSKEYRNTHEVTDYAEKLGISYRQLADLCKRCSGKRAKDIINGQLVAEAKRMLQFSSTPVKEISYLLNFATPYQFSNFFKKETQFSPNEYRTQFVKIGI